MAIVNVTGISGINSITAQSTSLNFYTASGNTLSIGASVSGNITGNVTGNLTGNVNATGVSTFSGGVVVAAGSVSAPSISPSGDSNTGIFFPSADTIAFGEGGVEAARFDSGGRLGIGTVPKTWTSGYNVLQVGSASLVGQPEQDGQTTNWSNNAYFDTNDNRWEYGFADQASQITQSDGLIIFKTASTGTANAALSWTESARFNTSGNLAFPSGQGIDFSANSNAAGMTSELFNDYEIGTYTPVLSGGGYTYTSGSYTAGRYTKVGRIVTVEAHFNISAISGSSDGSSTRITLPFAPSDLYTAGRWCQVLCRLAYFNSTAIQRVYCAQLTTNSSSADIVYYYTSGGAGTDQPVNIGADYQSASNNGQIAFTMTYATAS